MGALWTQFFPPSPSYTEGDIPSLAGRVYIVTGGNAGIGLELVKMLYAKGATVYIASRSATSIAAEIKAMESLPTATPGKIKGLILDLNDLSTISSCASTFLAQESRLDVLWHNAGIAQAPVNSTTIQGHETHMGVNVLGAHLLTQLLLPILTKTAKAAPKASVRIVFTGSGIVDMTGPPGGVSLLELQPGNHGKDKDSNYSASKAGNWLLSSEYDKRIRKHNILSVCQFPGTLRTKGWDRVPWLMKAALSFVMHEPKMGAYTELWTGLSDEVTLEDGGKCAIPWGRWHPSPRQDILESMKSKEEGGTGVAADFWDWCEQQTRAYT